jgi:hypothetical protein
MNKGSASIFVMIFGVAGSVFLGGVVMLTSLQHQAMVRNTAYEQALGIAEAGIHYYRWHLAHAPGDLTDGTGEPGPYVHEYRDPEGSVVGEYSLEIEAPNPGSSIVHVKSTGWTTHHPGVKRAIEVQMGVRSLARYAFLHNSSVFFGAGVEVHGPVMSNGGIRQDGINDALVQSALTTYTCGYETGCDTPEEKPGVWGSGGPTSLWTFPVPAIDFDSISIDFNLMKSDAQAAGTYYGPSGNLGYHVVFREEGTADVYRVTQAGSHRGMGADGRCTNIPQVIRREVFLANHSLENNHILFFEDTVWVDGIVDGRVTVAAAKFPIDAYAMDMWINGTTRYKERDGSSQLGLISQRNIFFIRDLPDDFELDAALMAKNGAVFRHGFHVPGCGDNGNSIRTEFTLYGSIVSGEPSAWNWGTPPGSGFVTRGLTHDSHLIYNPPPYFPSEGTGLYEVITWSEVSP